MHESLALTREQVRRVDRIAIERYGFGGVVLMENAGRGVVEVLLGEMQKSGGSELENDLPGQSPLPIAARTVPPALGQLPVARARCSHPLQGEGAGGDQGARGEGDRGTQVEVAAASPVVAILCGKGNNGGDGFVIARHLRIRGVAVTVLLAFPADQLTGDARINYEILTRCDVPIVELPCEGLVDELDRRARGAAWLVDALLGTGATGEPREPIASIIHWMNEQPGRRLAVDVPSGLDCDTGRPAAATVRADVTCTFVAPKAGMVQAAAGPFVGELHVVSIGVPAGVIREATGEFEHEQR